jgi:hypothetical protein
MWVFGISRTLFGSGSSLYSYFIKEGTVSESGTHDELIARRGDYYDYVQLQVLNH